MLIECNACYHVIFAFKNVQACTFDTEYPEKGKVKIAFESKDLEVLNFVRGKDRFAYEFLIQQNQMLENKKGVATSFFHFNEGESCVWQ